MMAFFINLPPCLIGIEACGSAHHWARELQNLGHTVKLMAPQFVKPYVKTNKNDMADAEAICEVVSRPNMRFVSVKTVGNKQSCPCTVSDKACQSPNRAVEPDPWAAGRIWSGPSQGGWTDCQRIPEILEDADNGLLGMFPQLIARLLAHFNDLHRQVLELEDHIKAWHRDNPASRWLINLLQRRNPNIAAVALANKNARIVWALLAHDGNYQSACASTIKPA